MPVTLQAGRLHPPLRYDMQGPAAPGSKAHADISATSGSGVQGRGLGLERKSLNKGPLQPSAKHEPPEAAAALGKGGTAAMVTTKHGAYSGGGRFWEGDEQPLHRAGGAGGGAGVAQPLARAQNTSSAAAVARATESAGAAESARAADRAKRRRMEAAPVQPSWAWEGGLGAGAGYPFPGPGGAYPAVRDWGPEQAPWDPSAGGRPRPYNLPYCIPYGMSYDTPYGMPYGLLPGSAAGGAQSSGFRGHAPWDGGQGFADRGRAGWRLPPLSAAPEWGGGPAWGGGPGWGGDPGWQDQSGFAQRADDGEAADAGPWCDDNVPLMHAICPSDLNICQEPGK